MFFLHFIILHSLVSRKWIIQLPSFFSFFSSSHHYLFLFFTLSLSLPLSLFLFQLFFPHRYLNIIYYPLFFFLFFIWFRFLDILYNLYCIYLLVILHLLYVKYNLQVGRDKIFGMATKIIRPRFRFISGNITYLHCFHKKNIWKS